MEKTLPNRCRRYVLIIGWTGLLPIAWALWAVAVHPPHTGWYLLVPLALLNGPLSVRIPSMRATISVSEGILFTCTLLFGPAAATIIAAIDGLAVSLWSRNRTAVQTLFGVGEPAISIFLASLLFYSLADVPPLLHRSASLVALLPSLLAFTVTYFVLNTLCAGMAVWLDVGGKPISLLRQHLPNLALDFSVGLSVGAAVIQTSGSPALAGFVVLVPMLLAGYISSHHTAVRLEDTNRHLGELRRLYDSTIETLAMAVDAKDQVTHGHIRRVQVLSTRLAREMGASDQEMQGLTAAALLHDLGKLAVPEHILNKPGQLTPAEYEEMKKHAAIGASILSAIHFPFPVAPLVRHHHENWDGTGYPDGLKGNDIPLGARILAIVDCYDALTSDRPYRRRMSHNEALTIIRSRSGRMYDPVVVQGFLDMPTTVEDLEKLEPIAVHCRPVSSQASPVLPPIRRAATETSQRYPAAAVRLIAALQPCGWDQAGRAVATLMPGALPDSVGALFRFDAARHQLVLAGLDRSFDARLPDEVSVGAGVTGWVAANHQAIINSDAELDLGDAARLTRPPLRLCASIPISTGAHVSGVLTVYSPYAFSETDRLVIEAVAVELSTILDGRDVTTAIHPDVPTDAPSRACLR